MRNYLAYMAMLLLLAAVLRIDFYFDIVYFLGAVYIAARLWMHHTYRKLSITRTFSDRVFCGETVTIDLVVKNGSRLPVPWIELLESTPTELTLQHFQEQVVTLGPRERRVFRYTLAARRRGYYEIGPLALHAGDLLDIERKYAQWAETRPLIVYPRIVPLARPTLPSHSALVALPSRSPLFEDASRIRGVRDYQRGDSPRRIHWSATARTGQILVKQLQPAIARDTLVCLDLDTGSYDNRYHTDAVEMAVVVAASLANRVIVTEGLPAGLLTEAWDPMAEDKRTFVLPASRERTHLMGILEVLARIETTRDIPMAVLLQRHRASLPWGTTVIVVTGSASEELAETAISLRRGGLAIATVLVRPPGAIADLQIARWSATGVPIRRVWTDTELAAWS